MKTKNYLLLLMCCVASISLFGRNIVSETRKIGAFHSLSAMGSADVIYTKSKNYTLEIRAEDGVAPKIETIVVNGVLTIKNKKSYNTTQDVKIYITAPTLNHISISGSCDFEATIIENSGDMKFDASGSSDIEIGTITASNIVFNLMGSSDAEIKNLKAKTLTISNSGSSDVEMKIDVDSTLLDSKGSSDVSLSGKSNSININCSGSSDVNIKNLSYRTIMEQASGSSEIYK